MGSHWLLLHGRPRVEISLTDASNSSQFARNLLADSGAGTMRAGFEILLREQDCLMAGGMPAQPVRLGGAYRGTFPIYVVRVRVSGLDFDHRVPAVAVPDVPPGFDGIASFRFLNRFRYGNCGDPRRFGLEEFA